MINLLFLKYKTFSVCSSSTMPASPSQFLALYKSARAIKVITNYMYFLCTKKSFTTLSANPAECDSR
jgi:hypothetical protein